MDEKPRRKRGGAAAGLAGASPAVIANSIRVARRRKGMTLAGLAERIDLDKGYLSRLERGEKTPSIGALLKIAEALDVQVGHLFGETTSEDAVTVIRHDALSEMAVEGGSLTQGILSVDGQRRLSAFLMEPSMDSETRHAEHPGDEMLYVLDGSVEIAFPDRVVRLNRGDCAHFDGHLRHLIRRVSRTKAQILIVIGQDLPRRPNEIEQP